MKILILRVSAIGDVIHTLPAVFLIKKYSPQAQISWVVQKKAASTILNQPFLENVFVLNDKFLKIKNIYSTLKIIKEIRRTKWDAIIDFQGLHKTSALLMFLHGKKFGFSTKHARSKISTYFTDVCEIPEYKNIIQKNLSLASRVATELFNTKECPTIEELKKDFSFEFESKGKIYVDEWLIKNNIKKFILMCPNTTWETKHWPEENWVEFAILFNEQNMNLDLLLVGHDFGAAAKNIAEQIIKQNISVKIVPGMDLNATSYLISKATLVIAPDTGLLHMADFLGIKAIGIFGPTNKDVLGGFLTRYNVKSAIQVYKPNRWNLKKTTQAHGNMYKLNARMLLDKLREDLK